jgi:protein involved in polysaccharide export with SLBB domain
VAGPLTARSEFEIFVEDAAGSPLPVYGRQLFNQVPTTFAPVDRVPVPANYVIGPGDGLVIRVWGKIDLESSPIVDRNGQIYLPKVGTLSVAGLRYDELEGYFRTAVGNLYKGFELNVTMGQLRSIQIFVLGSARQPGVYTVSSLSTLVNALFVSGGPSATGSMRHIELRRAGGLLTDFDIYALLRNGDKSRDVRLLPGDVIYIPPVGPQVAIVGSVNDPGIYELNGDTTVASALRDASGLTSLAGTSRVLLERIENHRRRRVDGFALDPTGLQRVLRDGDLLRIFPISPQFDNAVTLRGNVPQPGRFPWHEGMRIAALIPSRNFLITRDYWNQQNHLGGSTHIDMVTDLAQNTAEINWDYAAIERLDEQDLSTRVVAFNLGNAIDNPASTDNQLLKAGDIITIFSRQDLPLPLEKHATFVRIGGEVNAPGVYRVKPEETLRSVVERAGGLTPHSYLYASQLTRISTRLAEEEQLRLSVAQMQKELISRNAVAPPPNSASATDQQMLLSTQQAAITQLATMHPTGRIVLAMEPDAGTVADIPAFPLEDGDSFYIPPKLSTVQIAGAVYNENAFRYQPKKHLSAYLNDAGGPTRQADTKRIFLIRADGTVVSRQNHTAFWRDNFEKLTVLPGDAIIVPTKTKGPSNFMQQLPLFTQILSQTALTGAVLGTAY